MKDPSVRLILDTSAVLAYAATSIHVGETIAEVVDDGGAFGVTAVCLAEAARQAGEERAGGVPLLVNHPRCVVLPVLADDWAALAVWATALGRVDLATAMVEAVDRGAYVLTGEPERYGDELPVIPIDG